MFEGWEGAYVGYVTEQPEAADAAKIKKDLTGSICYPKILGRRCTLGGRAGTAVAVLFRQADRWSVFLPE